MLFSVAAVNSRTIRRPGQPELGFSRIMMASWCVLYHCNLLELKQRRVSAGFEDSRPVDFPLSLENTGVRRARQANKFWCF